MGDLINLDRNLDEIVRETTISRLRAEINHRDIRAKLLGKDLLHGPAWDIVIAVFLANLEDRDCNVNHALEAARCPISTANRAVARLEEGGILFKEHRHTDGRVVLLKMTPAGAKLVRSCLTGG